MTKLKLSIIAASLMLAQGAFAQENVIKKNLSERIPGGKIEEISKTPIKGIYEVRINKSDIVYSDEKGDFIFQGVLIDTKTKSNLTEARVNKLTKIEYASLPLKDAITLVKGNGSGKLAIFADPNCGYCKRLEKEIQNLKDVTIQVFLYPVLGADSLEKSKNIWCAKDRSASWLDWMVRGVTPATASCDTSAIDRNVAYGKEMNIQGTPTLVFKDGSRAPGYIPLNKIEAKI